MQVWKSMKNPIDFIRSLVIFQVKQRNEFHTGERLFQENDRPGSAVYGLKKGTQMVRI